jgi:uncharacterized protein (TIGR00369 family)
MTDSGFASTEDFFNRFDQDPFHKYLGLTLEEHKADFARVRLSINESTPTGIGGSVNGGVIATIIDMAAVPAVFTNMREDSLPAGTADMSITYLRQSHGAWVDASATVIKRGRQLCTIEVKVENDQGELCAIGRVLYGCRAI